MKMFIDLLHTYIPACPPIVGLVGIYLLVCLFAYWATRERGYLVTLVTGGLFMIPYFMH